MYTWCYTWADRCSPSLFGECYFWPCPQLIFSLHSLSHQARGRWYQILKAKQNKKNCISMIPGIWEFTYLPEWLDMHQWFGQSVVTHIGLIDIDNMCMHIICCIWSGIEDLIYLTWCLWGAVSYVNQAHLFLYVDTSLVLKTICEWSLCIQFMSFNHIAS